MPPQKERGQKAQAEGGGAYSEALPLSLALKDSLLDKVKGGARLALHAPEAPVAHVWVIEAAHNKTHITVNPPFLQDTEALQLDSRNLQAQGETTEREALT